MAKETPKMILNHYTILKKKTSGKIKMLTRFSAFNIFCILPLLIILSFNIKDNKGEAPCTGVYFKVDLINFPCDFSIDPSHFLFYYGDSNSNNIPDEIMLSANQEIPAYMGYHCVGIPVFACMVAYNRDDVEIGSSGLWKPKLNAVPICVVRYYDE